MPFFSQLVLPTASATEVIFMEPTQSPPASPSILPPGSTETEVLVNNKGIWMMAPPNFSKIVSQPSLSQGSTKWETEVAVRQPITVVVASKRDYSYPRYETDQIDRMFKYETTDAKGLYVEGPEDGTWKQYNDDFKLVNSGEFTQSYVQLDEVGTHYLEVLPPDSFTEDMVPVYISQKQPLPKLVFDTFQFDGKEGSAGYGKVKLASKPNEPVHILFSAYEYVTVDVDRNLTNGHQIEMVFTPDNWDTFQDFAFIAEIDGNGTNDERFVRVFIARPALYEGELPIKRTISPPITESTGVVQDTYVPDSSQFNIYIDARYSKNITPAMKSYAQSEADEWAALIKDEYPTEYTAFPARLMVDDGSYSGGIFYVLEDIDDLVIYLTDLGSTTTAAAIAGPLRNEDDPRTGMIGITPGGWSLNETQFRQMISHEIGHVLGLLGTTPSSASLLDIDNLVFKGTYSKALNNNQDIPLNPEATSHPANTVDSIMSYGYIYTRTAPTAMDKALLADHGYTVVGVND